MVFVNQLLKTGVVIDFIRFGVYFSFLCYFNSPCCVTMVMSRSEGVDVETNYLRFFWALQPFGLQTEGLCHDISFQPEFSPDSGGQGLLCSYVLMCQLSVVKCFFFPEVILDLS